MDKKLRARGWRKERSKNCDGLLTIENISFALNRPAGPLRNHTHEAQLKYPCHMKLVI
jgi:hypothetical protein